MGYGLMWIEALLASLFYSALFLRRLPEQLAVSKQENPLHRFSLRAILIVCVVIPVVLGCVIALVDKSPIVLSDVVPPCLAFLALTLGFIWAYRSTTAFWGIIFLNRIVAVLLPLILSVGLICLINSRDSFANIEHLWGKYIYAWTLCYVLMMVWLCNEYFFFKTSFSILMWSTDRLFFYFAVLLGLLVATFMSIDASVKTHLQSLRGEANALALSVMPQRIPDRDNAAILYEKAFELPCYYYGRLHSQERIKEMGDIEMNFLKDNFDPHTESVQHYVSFFAGATAYLKQATTLPDCYFEKEYGYPNATMQLPELSKFRQSTKILAIEALSCAARGDVSTALHNIATMQRMAQHLAQSPILISTLVTRVIDDVAKQTLERILKNAQPKLSDFDTSPVWVCASHQRNFQRVMVEEKACMLNAVADVSEGNVEHFQNGLLSFYRVFLAEFELTQLRSTFDGMKESVANKDLIPPKDNNYNVGTSLLFGLWFDGGMEVFSRASIGAARTDASNNLMTLALAMAKYRAQNGSYPEKLDALVPAFLPCIPLDPFDREPLKMTRKGDELWLYSVGDEKKPLPEKYTPSNSAYDYSSDFVRIFRLKLKP